MIKMNVPNGWRKTRLGDLLLKIEGGGTPSRQVPEYYDGDIPWATVKDLSDDNYKTDTIEHISEKGLKNSSAKIVKKGNFIISTRMGLGRGFINKVDMAINQDLKGLYPDKNKLDVVYLMYWYKSQKRRLELLGSGSTVKGIDLKLLRSLKIYVMPLEEQQKIAAILSTWDKAIELKEKLIEQKKEQKKGLMQKLLTGEVRLPGFYEKWEKRQIGELITESKVIADEPDLNKRITVRLNLKGVQKREVTSVEKENVTTQYVRRAGQFIYGKQNLYKGAIGIVPEELDGFQSSSDIPSFDFNSDVDGLWFYYYFSRESFYSYLEVISTGTGSKRVNPKDLFRIKINVPPLDEQRQISKILLSQDQEIKLLEKELKALKMQKKGLMQLLLTGKIRVKV